MKKSILLLLPTLAVSLLSGCGNGGGSNEVTLTIWEDESNKAVVESLAKEWAGAYMTQYPLAPKININVVKQTEKSAIEKMGTVASTGHGPDIAAVTHDTISGGVSNRLLSPVKFVHEMEEIMTEDALDAVSVNNELYGYPITAESMVLMYDKSQVSDVSKLASFESIKANDLKVGLQLTGDDAGYYTWGLYTDSVLFGEKGKTSTEVNIATTKSIDNVTKFYNEYAKDHIFDYAPNVNLPHLKAKRIQGIICAPYMLSQAKNSLGENLGIAKVPTINDENERPFSGYKAYVVSKYSTNGALAHDLAAYLVNYSSQAYRLQQLGYLPACHLDENQDIIDLIDASEEAGIFSESLNESMVMPSIPAMNGFWSLMNNASSNFKTKGAELTKADVQSTLQEVTKSLLGQK